MRWHSAHWVATKKLNSLKRKIEVSFHLFNTAILFFFLFQYFFFHLFYLIFFFLLQYKQQQHCMGMQLQETINFFPSFILSFRWLILKNHVVIIGALIKDQAKRQCYKYWKGRHKKHVFMSHSFAAEIFNLFIFL